MARCPRNLFCNEVTVFCSSIDPWGLSHQRVLRCVTRKYGSDGRGTRSWYQISAYRLGFLRRSFGSVFIRLMNIRVYADRHRHPYPEVLPPFNFFIIRKVFWRPAPWSYTSICTHIQEFRDTVSLQYTTENFRICHIFFRILLLLSTNFTNGYPCQNKK